MIQTIPASVSLPLVCGLALTTLAAAINTAEDYPRLRRQSSAAQNEEKAWCKLPSPQQNGQFSPSRYRCPPNNTEPLCQMTPGNLVPHNWPLFHSCDPGFALNRSNTVSVCLDGVWRPALPGCVVPCPPLNTTGRGESLDSVISLRCIYKDQEVTCGSERRPGTVASAVCNPFYRTGFEMVCTDTGLWVKQNRSIDRAGNVTHNEFYCTPECGLSKKSSVLRRSTSSVRSSSNEFPWVAGIYYKNEEKKWELRCVGTLITTQNVILPAHCVTDQGVKMEPEKLRIGLGKHYNNFYTVQSSSGIFEVEHVSVPDSYIGIANFFASDIALLRLLLEVPVSASIMPVCVDWSHQHPPAANTTFTVAGWERGEAGAADYITSAAVKIIAESDCKASIQGYFSRLLPKEKFCVEIEGGNENYRGLSGQVVTYEEDNRYFMVGYLSSKVNEVYLATNISYEDNARFLRLLDKPLGEQL